MIGTLEQLYDYEAIEDAWKAILGKKHLVFLEFNSETRNASEKPYIEVSLQSVTPIAEYPYRGELLRHGWQATLINKIVTARGFNSDKHRGMVGSVRLAIMLYKSTFTPAVLPYHSVVSMKEMTLTRGVDEMHDWSELHAEVVFYVRDNAWPPE